jgi:V/A-type H+-transporting ATPase subunit D
MAQLQLNKSSLANEAKNLVTYKRFFPSLDLKRQQLTAERNKAKTIVNETAKRIRELEFYVADQLPMLANQNIDLEGVVELSHANIETENIVGTHLPKLSSVEIKVKPFSVMATPHWFDNVVATLKKMLELQVFAKVNDRRLQLLD